MDDLKLIKKHYGEKMMHLCRELFPTILEKEGLLFETLSSKYEFTRFLYDDIIEQKQKEGFKNFIYSLVDVEEKETAKIDKTPFELMDEAGYILYECKSEKDIQSFRHYYKRSDNKVLKEYKEGDEPEYYNGEELCTFNGNRLNNCFVFFAVKKNVDEIKREDFVKPDRQDEYGTSVISLQFSRGKVNTLSIKNRYNHTVNNPDSTFSNNLDNIIDGLTKSFEKEYNLNINSNRFIRFELNNYVLANDKKFHRYNYEINNIYYCPNNEIIEGSNTKQFLKEKFILLDYFVLDLANKKIFLYDKKIPDYFPETIPKIDKLIIENESETQNKKIIINDEIIITINNKNQIIGYKNDLIEKIGNIFLYYSRYLDDISLSNVEEIGNSFLYENNTIKKISLPKVRKIGDDFINNDSNLSEIDLPNVEEIGDYFAENCKALESLSFPKLKMIGVRFVTYNQLINSVDLPNVISIGEGFLKCNYSLKEISLPKVNEIGDYFLTSNVILESINLPELLVIDDFFLAANKFLKEISLPKVKKIGDLFLESNKEITKIEFPEISKIGDRFLLVDTSLQRAYLPELEYLGDESIFEKLRNDYYRVYGPIPKIYAPLVKYINTTSLLEYASYKDTCVKLSDVKKIIKESGKKIKELSDRDIDILWDHANMKRRQEEYLKSQNLVIESGRKK